MVINDQREDLLNEKAAVDIRMAEISIDLLKKLPNYRYAQLMTEKKKLGIKVLEINSKLRALNKERQQTLAEAFMQTTIQMFDPQDISEIWDRVYAENQHLSRG